MADNCDTEKPFYFSKLDIKDGFWRMVVAPEQAWNFAYVLPPEDGKMVTLEETELVVPDALQMGWCESPPFFCTASETARDVIQELIDRQDLLPPHKFETKMIPSEIANTIPLVPIQLLEVFVDDFIGATNEATRDNFTHLSRCMLHGVHSIFPPAEVTEHGGGDSIAEKKLNANEGKWEPLKEILGWLVNGTTFTIQLPQDKVDKILRRLKKIKQFKRKIPRKILYEIAGSLEHASYGIPGGAGLFSPIQKALQGNHQWIKVTTNLKTCFQDWGAIVKYMAKHPTHVKQLVKGLPSYVGFSDSCKLGTGGIWSGGLVQIVPILWSIEWPTDIKQRFVDGIITINDLELAGMVINWLVLECLAPTLQFKHAALFCDNSSAVQWAYKLRSSASEVAGRLLRLLGLRIHKRESSHISSLGIIGDDNIMADIVSRAFKQGKYFFAQNNLTTYFNVHFPLPQNLSWTEYTPPERLTQRVMSCLRGEPLTMGSLLRLPQIEKSIGKNGFDMLPPGASIPTSNSVNNSRSSSWSGLLLHRSGQASSEEAFKSKFRPLQKPSRPSQRPSVWLENPAPSKRQKTSMFCPSNNVRCSEDHTTVLVHYCMKYFDTCNKTTSSTLHITSIMTSKTVYDLENLLINVRNKHKILGPDFCGEVATAADNFMKELSKSVGKNILHKLHEKKPSEESLRAIITALPSALSVQDDEKLIPIQSAVWEEESLKYVELLAQEGARYGVGGKGKRGGLLSDHPTEESNCLQMIAEDYVGYCHKSPENVLVYLKILKGLRNANLFTVEDIREYDLLFRSCNPNTEPIFNFLCDMDPEAMMMPITSTGSPLMHTCFQYGIDFGTICLRATLKHHPDRIGLLFQRNCNGQTAMEAAVSINGKNETFQAIRECIPQDTQLPILHFAAKYAPQYMNDFTNHYHDAVHLRDRYGRTLQQAKLGSGNTTFERDAQFFTCMKDDEIVEVDPRTGLYPFMLAASSGKGKSFDLRGTYYLLRRKPDLINSDEEEKKDINRNIKRKVTMDRFEEQDKKKRAKE